PSRDSPWPTTTTSPTSPASPPLSLTVTRAPGSGAAHHLHTATSVAVLSIAFEERRTHTTAALLRAVPMNSGLAPTDLYSPLDASNAGGFGRDTDQAAAKCCCSTQDWLD